MIRLTIQMQLWLGNNNFSLLFWFKIADNLFQKCTRQAEFLILLAIFLFLN